MNAISIMEIAPKTVPIQLVAIPAHAELDIPYNWTTKHALVSATQSLPSCTYDNANNIYTLSH